MKCLYIIDVQNGFVTHETKHVIAKIEKLILSGQFTHIAFARFINQPNSAFVSKLNDDRMLDDIECGITPSLLHFVNHVFTRHGYSAVIPDFMTFLKEQQIQDVTVCGIDTDACVLTTVLDLFGQGVNVSVASDCCASTGGMWMHESALSILRRSIGREAVKIHLVEPEDR